MRLKDWAAQQGIHYQTAWRWFRDGRLPVPALQAPSGTILVQPNSAPQPDGGLGLYARVSSHDQRADLDRQVARLTQWAATAQVPLVRVEVEVASGMTGRRPKLRRLLADPAVTTVVVTHRDRLARMHAELVEAALAAHGRRLVVLDDGEVTDDLIRDMVAVLTSLCAGLYGRRSARNRAEKAVRCAQRDVGRPVSQVLGSIDLDDPDRPFRGSLRLVRSTTPPFVVAPPTGARVGTRLRVNAADEQVLSVVGAHLGGLAGSDLAARCRLVPARPRRRPAGRPQARVDRGDVVSVGGGNHADLG